MLLISTFPLLVFPLFVFIFFSFSSPFHIFPQMTSADIPPFVQEFPENIQNFDHSTYVGSMSAESMRYDDPFQQSQHKMISISNNQQILKIIPILC